MLPGKVCVSGGSSVSECAALRRFPVLLVWLSVCNAGSLAGRFIGSQVMRERLSRFVPRWVPRMTLCKQARETMTNSQELVWSYREPDLACTGDVKCHCGGVLPQRAALAP